MDEGAAQPAGSAAFAHYVTALERFGRLTTASDHLEDHLALLESYASGLSTGPLIDAWRREARARLPELRRAESSASDDQTWNAAAGKTGELLQQYTDIVVEWANACAKTAADAGRGQSDLAAREKTLTELNAHLDKGNSQLSTANMAGCLSIAWMMVLFVAMCGPTAGIGACVASPSSEACSGGCAGGSVLGGLTSLPAAAVYWHWARSSPLASVRKVTSNIAAAEEEYRTARSALQNLHGEAAHLVGYAAEFLPLVSDTHKARIASLVADLRKLAPPAAARGGNNA